MQRAWNSPGRPLARDAMNDSERLHDAVKVGSLFSGIGGLDLGLERAGMEIKWQIEKDEFCCKVLERRWPNARRYGDIRAVDPHELDRVDLVCGGFPCQPWSVAGRGDGESDDRNMWPETIRIIRGVGPRLVILENVPGILNHRYFGTILGDLAESGFDAEWDCIPAAAVGAPHLRYRLFIVAWDSTGSPTNVFSPSSAPRSTVGKSGVVADPNSIGFDANGRHASPVSRCDEPQDRVSRTDGALADPESSRRSMGWRESRDETPHTRSECPGEGVGELDWWAVEPDVGRVAYGVPARVDRLKGLGNAVVPQVTEWIGRRIMNAINDTERLQ